MTEEIKEIIRIAKSLNMDKNDLLRESETIDEYGEYEHMELIGFNSKEIAQASIYL